jgi:hypothetical protein
MFLVKVMANQELKDTAIDLDDHYFKGCTLIGCTLTFSGRDFGMHNCRMVDCHLQLGGEAARMIQLLAQLDIVPEISEDSQPVASSWVH